MQVGTQKVILPLYVNHTYIVNNYPLISLIPLVEIDLLDHYSFKQYQTKLLKLCLKITRHTGLPHSCILRTLQYPLFTATTVTGKVGLRYICYNAKVLRSNHKISVIDIYSVYRELTLQTLNSKFKLIVTPTYFL